MKNILILLILLCSFQLTEVIAQINIGGTPRSAKKAMSQKAPVVNFEKLNMTVIQAEDLADDEKGFPPRFGFPHESDINIKNAGIWETLADESGRIWRVSIHCPKASTINLLYDAFWLPEGSTLYIYNEDRSQTIGGFTAKNNNSPRGESIGYATGLLKGNTITLEYFEPIGVEETAELSISHVVHGYQDLEQDLTRAFGDSGSCQVNINCADGNNYQNEKSSVALMLVGGTRWCTGSLLNATGDFLPYFLSANHCLDGWAIPTPFDAITNPVASTWSFYWNYEAAGCANPSTEPGWTSTTGAYIVANKADSDFALFYLTEDPYRDAGLILSYNGWSTTNSPGAGGAGIHHPSGDIKKISRYIQTPWNNQSCAPTNTWSVIFQHPSNIFTTTEPGSSGSPLYDNNRRVIGQLWGGVNPSTCVPGPTCSDPANDMSFYGKFGVSWDDTAGPQRRLKDWLDPTCHINYTIPSNFGLGVSHNYAEIGVFSNRTVTGANTHVSYHGGDLVHLTAGFQVSGGARFHANNESCASTLMTENGESDMIMPGPIVVANIDNSNNEGEEMIKRNEERELKAKEAYDKVVVQTKQIQKEGELNSPATREEKNEMMLQKRNEVIRQKKNEVKMREAEELLQRRNEEMKIASNDAIKLIDENDKEKKLDEGEIIRLRNEERELKANENIK